MKNSNSSEHPPWEERLASWKPRPPSPRVKRTLFGTAADPAGSTAAVALVGSPPWRWLVPALGCLILVFLAAGSFSVGRKRLVPDGAGAMIASVVSNFNNAAYLTAALHSGQNALRTETLEWTVSPRSTSNGGSFRLIGTNILLQ